jgi:uncharacterized protein YjlB
MMITPLTANAKVDYETFPFHDDGTYPNNAELPLILMHKVFNASPDVPPQTIEKTFRNNGWVNSWRNGLYSFHHYHSTAHESLGVYSGWVKAQFGGPEGKSVVVKAGDLIIVPAGVSHKNLDQSPDFRVVGAYPRGQMVDMNYGKPGERPRADENIKNLPQPESDPVHGKNGPLIRLW